LTYHQDLVLDSLTVSNEFWKEPRDIRNNQWFLQEYGEIPDDSV
jgi:hypothetical protein